MFSSGFLMELQFLFLIMALFIALILFYLISLLYIHEFLTNIIFIPKITSSLNYNVYFYSFTCIIQGNWALKTIGILTFTMAFTYLLHHPPIPLMFLIIITFLKLVISLVVLKIVPCGMFA